MVTPASCVGPSFLSILLRMTNFLNSIYQPEEQGLYRSLCLSLVKHGKIFPN